MYNQTVLKRKEALPMLKNISAFLGLVLLGCLMGTRAYTEEITIDGATANAGIVKALADAYQESHPGNTVTVVLPGVGHNGGIKGCVNGKFTLGRIGKPLTENDKQPGLNQALFCKIPMLFIVNEKTPVDNLTSAQICDIFSGKIENWKDLGGPDQKIYVLTRNKDAATLGTIREKVTGFKDLTITERAIVKLSDEEQIDAVAKKEGTLGFCVSTNIKGQKVKIIKVDGISHTSDTYPIMATVGLVYMNQLTGLAKEFVDFIYGAQGAEVIQKMHCLPLKKE